MRLLFYTATAILLIFAGVFAFYAVQPGDSVGPAKVVLSIDADQQQAQPSDTGAASATQTADAGGEADSSLLAEFDSREPQQQAETESLISDPAFEAVPPEDDGTATAKNTDRLAGDEPASAARLEPGAGADAVGTAEPSSLAALQAEAPDTGADQAGQIEASPDERTETAPDPAPAGDDTAAVDSETDAASDDEPFLLPGTTISGWDQPAQPSEPEISAQDAASESAESGQSAGGTGAPTVSVMSQLSEMQSESSETSEAADEASVSNAPDEAASPESQAVASLDETKPETARLEPRAEQAPGEPLIESSESADAGAETDTVTTTETGLQPTDGLPIADSAESTGQDSQEKSTDRLLTDAPSETDGVADETTGQADNALDTAEIDKNKLKQDFEAFMATMKEREAGEGEDLLAETEPAPPAPRRRPGDIPPPVKTASIESGWTGQQVAAGAVSTSDGPRVGILLRGVGRDNENSEKAVTQLPSAVSLAFMPLSAGAPRWSQEARQDGHEVLVQLPLEPSNYPMNNPGPETLISSAGSDKNLSNLRNLLGRVQGHSGVTNYLGGNMLKSEEGLRPILQALKSEGLIYVGEGDESHALVRGLAAELGVHYGDADVMIDARPSPEGVANALDQLAAIAREKGSAIGMGFASKTTIEQLAKWTESVKSKGVTLVPVGTLARTPGAS